MESFGTAVKESVLKDESVVLDGLGKKTLIEERWRKVCEQSPGHVPDGESVGMRHRDGHWEHILRTPASFRAHSGDPLPVVRSATCD